MEELKMIEMMDELLDMINGNEKSKTKLMYVQETSGHQKECPIQGR